MSENANVIDEKKKEEKTIEPEKKMKQFFFNYFYSIIGTIIIGIFIVGGVGLYTTKVAQSNILPDNIDLAPYTDKSRGVNAVTIDMHVMRPYLWSTNEETFTQKVKFDADDYLNTFKDGFLCYLKTNGKPNSGTFSNIFLFLSKVCNSIVVSNFTIINTMFYYFSFLPESIFMLLYGVFGMFIWIVLYFINIFISVVFHGANLFEFFRQPKEDNDNEWEESTETSIFRIKKLLLMMIYIPFAILSVFVCSILFTIYGLITPLYAKYNINASTEKSDIRTFIKDTFIYKKFFFMILASVSLIGNGTKYLGNGALMGIAIAILFAYAMGLYKNEIQTNNGFTQKITGVNKGGEFTNNDVLFVCNSKNGKNFKATTIPVQKLPTAPTDKTPAPTATTNQLGGKRKLTKLNKKYNIRLV